MSSTRTTWHRPCSRTSSAIPSGRANLARFAFLDPRARTFYRGLGEGGQRHRRCAARGGRSEAIRPRTVRPCRAALDAERRVPGALGGARRRLPPRGDQADAPSPRGRPDPRLRDARAARRPGARRCSPTPPSPAHHRRKRCATSPAGARRGPSCRQIPSDPRPEAERPQGWRSFTLYGTVGRPAEREGPAR